MLDRPQPTPRRSQHDRSFRGRTPCLTRDAVQALGRSLSTVMLALLAKNIFLNYGRGFVRCFAAMLCRLLIARRGGP